MLEQQLENERDSFQFRFEWVDAKVFETNDLKLLKMIDIRITSEENKLKIVMTKLYK